VIDCRPQRSIIDVGSMHDELVHARAIESPISGEMVFTVPGNAAPVLVALA
jgi:hypothetical protein